jgi:hypothetical protein
MAYSKVPKLCQDAPAGVQTVNGLGSNLESLRTDLEREHSALTATADVPIIGGGNSNYSFPTGGVDIETGSADAGKHDHPLIPRGEAYVAQVTSGDPFIISSYGVQLYAKAGCLQSMQVLDTGVYFFPISGFARVWGRATALADSLLTGITVDARVQPGTPTGSGATGLIVKTFRIQDNGTDDEMLAFHTGFHLLAFGRRDPMPTAPPRAAPLRPGRFGAGPRGGPVRFPRGGGRR